MTSLSWLTSCFPVFRASQCRLLGPSVRRPSCLPYCAFPLGGHRSAVGGIDPRFSLDPPLLAPHPRSECGVRCGVAAVCNVISAHHHGMAAAVLSSARDLHAALSNVSQVRQLACCLQELAPLFAVWVSGSWCPSGWSGLFPMQCARTLRLSNVW
eukprot:IDg21640t1